MKKQKWINLQASSDQQSVNSLNFSKLAKISETKTTIKQSADINLLKELAPNKVADLAVNLKKINEVRMWLTNNLSSTNKTPVCPILLLTGPVGCGKTTTIRLLAKEMKVDIEEWINPMDQELEFAQSQVARFREFLSQSKYCSLLLEAETRQKLLLIEDFPNFILNRPDDFISSLDKYYYTGKSPLIFICSDVQNSALNLNQTVFTQQMRDKFNIINISFNPISSSLLKSSLKRAQEVIKKYPDVFQSPSDDAIDAIICSAGGDIRSALHQLQFASLKDVKFIPINSCGPRKGTKRKRKTTVKFMEKNETLTLFHGLGRVLNPKRKEIGSSWRIDCDLNTLIDTFSTQPNTFTALLHENYIKYFATIEDVQKAADILSETENYLSKWSDRHESVSTALWYMILGLMVANEHHVGKWNQISGARKIERKITDSGSIRRIDGCYYNVITKTNKFEQFKY